MQLIGMNAPKDSENHTSEKGATRITGIVKIKNKGTMKKVTFKGLDPDDLHTCQHCQHSFHDIGMCQKVCVKSGQPIAPMDYIQVNDCEEYKSPYLSDYRRRTDLGNGLKNK